MKLLILIFVFVSQLAFAAKSKMAIMGDAGLTGPELNRLQNSIYAEKVTSLILPGDNLYLGRYTWTWNQWKRLGFKFDVVAIGNHHGGYHKEINYFEMPGEYYSTVKNGARFLVLNSDNQNNVAEQITWLRKQLAEANEKLIFLVFHHPSFDVGAEHSWRDKEAFQLQMRQIFKDYKTKISALLLGHEHISSFLMFGSLPVILAGAGREVLKSRPVSYEDQGFQIKTLYLAPMTQHWAQLEISENASEAWVHHIRVSDQYRSCSAFLKGGEITLAKNCAAN